MQQFVVSIEANGCVSGLQAKPGKGLDLRQLGRAEIRRASEIIWDDKHQKWCVEIQRGAYEGQYITTAMMNEACGSPLSLLGGAGNVIAYFDEYDQAVTAEIMVLDHIRRTEGADALR